MDNRFQYIFLASQRFVTSLALVVGVVTAPATFGQDEASSSSLKSINNEFFSLGVAFGMLNVEDFTSELTPSLSATFRASEDFFLQANYLRKDISKSAYETTQASLFSGDDRRFTHYDFLFGYNFFQGEFYLSSNESALANLYFVSGIGDTEFGGESSFTYTLGVGYEVSLSRHFALSIDFRDYIYQSTLVSDEKRRVNATHIGLGAKYQF
jgi:outer membrane beta-barrel protein